MNVVLHGWPDDRKAKRMHRMPTDEFQYMVVVPIRVWSGAPKHTAVTEQDLIFRFIYHDGTHYHYELTQQEFA